MIIFTILLILIVMWFAQQTKKSQAPLVQHKCSVFDYPFKTGDIVLFSQPLWIFRVFGGSFWGHVGLVWKKPETGELFIVEMTAPPHRNLPAILSNGNIQSSLRVAPLFRIIEKKMRHRERVAVRSISHEISSDKLLKLILEKHETYAFAFDYMAIGMKRATQFLMAGLPVTDRTETSPRFCAEFVCETLKKMGVLDENTVSERALTCDFVSDTQQMDFRNGWFYMAEVELSFRHAGREGTRAHA